MTPPETLVAEREFSAPHVRLEEDPHEWRPRRKHGRHEYARRHRPGRQVRAVSLRQRFNRLADRWEEDTAFESITPVILCHPDYLSIIALGEKVVPLILSRMVVQPAPWFSALGALTGQNPARDQDTLIGATNAWLQWGREASLMR